jgi:hypothetical protein
MPELISLFFIQGTKGHQEMQYTMRPAARIGIRRSARKRMRCLIILTTETIKG